MYIFFYCNDDNISLFHGIDYISMVPVIKTNAPQRFDSEYYFRGTTDASFHIIESNYYNIQREPRRLVS